MGYSYEADSLSIGEVEYLCSEWFAELYCMAGHSYIYIPGDLVYIYPINGNVF